MSDREPTPPLRTAATFRGAALRIAAVLLTAALADLALGFALDASRRRCAGGESGVIGNARAAAPDILILGSSRAKHHYDDRLLSARWGLRVFNTGQGGQGLPFSRVVLEQVAASKKPRAVIVDVMRFGADLERVHALDPWYWESPVLQSLPPVGGSADGKPTPPRKYRLLMRSACYRYSGKTYSHIRDAFKPRKSSGFAPFETRAPMVRDGAGDGPPQDAGFIPQLDALVDECRSLGAEVVLCFSPIMWDGYDRSVVGPVRDYASRKGVPFVNFNAPGFPGLNAESDFRDSQHLNAEGARRFSEAVAATLPAHLPCLAGRRPAP